MAIISPLTSLYCSWWRLQGCADKSVQVSNGSQHPHEAKWQHFFHSGDCQNSYFSKYCHVWQIHEDYRMEQAKRNAIAEPRRARHTRADTAKALKHPRTTAPDECNKYDRSPGPPTSQGGTENQHHALESSTAYTRSHKSCCSKSFNVK